jgi:hypothetical protein
VAFHTFARVVTGWHETRKNQARNTAPRRIHPLFSPAPFATVLRISLDKGFYLAQTPFVTAIAEL